MRRAHARMTLATMVAVLALAFEMRTLYRDPLYLTRAAMIVGAMSLLGLAVRLVWPRSRWLSWPLWAAQTALGGWLLLSLHRGAPVQELIAAAIDGIQTGTAPLGPSPGLSFLMLVVPWLVCAVLELFVHVGKLPGLSIIPLAGWYVVFALVPQPQARILTFVLVVAGYVAILAADTVNRAQRWRSGLREDSGSGSDVDGTVARIAALLLAPALVGGLVVGSTMPLFQPHELSGGDGTISMSDPKLDLRQNLHASVRREVLTYRSDIPGGTRLHLAVLTDLTRTGWDVRAFPATPLPVGNQAFPPAPGQGPASTRTRNTHLDIGTFPAQYLPLPYSPSTTNLTKRWGVDTTTMTVYTMEPSGVDATNHMSYDVTSTEAVPTADELNRVRGTNSGDQAMGVPAGMPEAVRRLTQDVVSNATTPLEKAAALQSFFREGAFTYDLGRAPAQGGFAGLEQFLFVERVGYCEQYASAYAAMARIAGLPSRVVVGFLPGEATPSGTYSVANLDMHAWPEVWFDGYGWLPFEPTPPQVSGEAPAYSQVGAPPVLESTPTPTPTVAPSSLAPAPTVEPDELTRADEGAKLEIPWPLVGGVAALAGLALLLLAPGWWRRRRREARLGLESTGADKTMALWEELRDTALDLGIPWPPDSPRGLVASLENRVSAPTAEGLRALAVAVERVRFATSPGASPTGGTEAVTAAVRELTDGAEKPARTKARWWPASLFRGLSPRRRPDGDATARGARHAGPAAGSGRGAHRARRGPSPRRGATK